MGVCRALAHKDILIEMSPHRLVRPRISRSQREDRGSNPLGDTTHNKRAGKKEDLALFGVFSSLL